MLLTHASPMKPASRATWHPLTWQAPLEESGIPSSSCWHPSHSPLSHPTSDMGAQEQKGGACLATQLARAGLGISQAPGAVPGALPAAAASALGGRRAQPFLPGTQRRAALSRQVPINGVFYLTGEIKSLNREAQKS